MPFSMPFCMPFSMAQLGTFWFGLGLGLGLGFGLGLGLGFSMAQLGALWVAWRGGAQGKDSFKPGFILVCMLPKWRARSPPKPWVGWG